MDHRLVSRLASRQRRPTREAVAKLCAGLELGREDADALWLAAGLLLPDLGGGEAATATLGVWWALVGADEPRRGQLAGVIAGTLAFAGA